MILPIITYPAEVLETVAEPVTEFDSELNTLVHDMLETMKSADGIGLAANQVNVLRRVIVIHIPYVLGKKEFWHDKVHVLINPEITYQSDEMINFKEGCLSFPGITEDVDRHANIELKAQDVFGNEFKLKANGLFSICVQHEIDHLNGIVFTERARQKDTVVSRLWKKLF